MFARLDPARHARFGLSNAPAAAATPVLVIEVWDKKFYANLEDNAAAQAFIMKLTPAEITVDMRDGGNFEKVGFLPWELPHNDEQIATEPGDIILYRGNQIAISCEEKDRSYTRLAKIGNSTKEELSAALGDGNVSVSFYLEWSE